MNERIRERLQMLLWVLDDLARDPEYTFGGAKRAHQILENEITWLKNEQGIRAAGAFSQDADGNWVRYIYEEQ